MDIFKEQADKLKNLFIEFYRALIPSGVELDDKAYEEAAEQINDLGLGLDVKADELKTPEDKTEGSSSTTSETTSTSSSGTSSESTESSSESSSTGSTSYTDSGSTGGGGGVSYSGGSSGGVSYSDPAPVADSSYSDTGAVGDTVPVAETAGTEAASPETATEAPSTSTSDLESKTIVELEGIRKEKHGNIVTKKNELLKVYAGDNENIKSAKTAEENAKNEYLTAIDNDSEEVKALKSGIEENINKIDETEKNIDTKKYHLTEYEKKRDYCNTVIANKQGLLTKTRVDLSALVAQKNNADNDKDISALDKQIHETQSFLKRIQDEINAKQKELIDNNREIEMDKADLTDLESQLAELNATKTDLENQLKEKANDATKQALEKYNQAKANTNKVKADEEKTAKDAIATAETEYKEVQDVLEKKRIEDSLKKINEHLRYENETNSNDDILNMYRTESIKEWETNWEALCNDQKWSTTEPTDTEVVQESQT